MRNIPMKNDKKTRLWCGLYLLVSAFFIMLLATRSSFLYPCNNWDDANSYFSVGKALFHGKMPYRDVFDQKGMYLYFFYGLCYLVSHTTFFGVFLMEILFAFVDLCGIFSIMCLYVKRSTALILTPPVLAVTFCTYSFYYGGSAEELCLPFLIWGLFLGINYFKEIYPVGEMPVKVLILAGWLAGMVANIKFTVLGFFFAWMMMVAFSILFKKRFVAAVKACLWFLLGMLLPFVPWFIYFAVRGGLYYWYWGYVYINVFSYSNLNAEGPSIGERIYTLSKILYYVILKNISCYVFLIPGFLFGTIYIGKKVLPHLFIPATAFFLFVGIYIGGSELPYYALPLSIFTVLGFALLGWLVERADGYLKEHLGHRVIGCADYQSENYLRNKIPIVVYAGVSLALSVLVVGLLSMNVFFMKVKKEDIFLYQFRDIVLETENPTLLNVGCLDAGLYTVCDIVPSCQWFQTQTINMDIVYEEQKRYIKEGLTDYVIARDGYPEKIEDRYELAAEATFEENGYNYEWYLFRLK